MKHFATAVPSCTNDVEFDAEQKGSGAKYLNVDNLRIPFLFAWLATVLLQALFWFDLDAAICAGLAALGGSAGILYALKRKTLLRSPVGALMILGFSAYYFVLPPFATFLEFKGLTNNLDEPVLVFIHSFICMLAIIGPFILFKYTFATVDEKICKRKVFKPIGFFSDVTVLQLFIMGAIGIIGNIISLSSGGINSGEAVGVFGKLVQGFYPLMYVPYCIALMPLLGRVQKLDRNLVISLLAYTIIILLVSIARNSRGVLFSGIASIIIAYSYAVAVKLIPKPRVKLTQLTLIVLLVSAISGPVSDFATAMVVVRQQRTDISALDLIDATLNQAQDKDGLKQYRVESAIKNGDWDEMYVDNIFLARLSNLKFSDQSLSLAMTLDDGSKSFLAGLEWQRVLSIFPQPVISFLGLDANKEFVTSASGGDFMLFAATGYKYSLGGFRTGSIFGSGYAIFGWFYPFVLLFLVIWIFAFVDAQVLNKSVYMSSNVRRDLIIFNPLCLTSLFTWMFYLTSAATGVESMSGLFGFLLRGWMQLVVTYGIALVVSRIIAKPFGGVSD